jgi:hypothetical protein
MKQQSLHPPNPLNTEFNPICHLLALLGAHHILHISRIRIIKPLHQNLKQFPIHSMYGQHTVMKKIPHVINTQHHGCFRNRSQVQTGNELLNHGKALQEMMSHPNRVIPNTHLTQHEATLQPMCNLQCVSALFVLKFSG